MINFIEDSCSQIITQCSGDLLMCYVEKAGLWRDIKFNPVPIEEYFHIIDEIGRLVACNTFFTAIVRQRTLSKQNVALLC